MAENGKPDRFLAGLLIAVGLLVLALSGTCTVNFFNARGFGAFPLDRPRPPAFNTGKLALFLIFGAPFLTLGALTALFGFRLFRAKRRTGAAVIGSIYLVMGIFGTVISILVLQSQHLPMAGMSAAICCGLVWLGWRTIMAREP